jgi:uncharacterized protein YkwD
MARTRTHAARLSLAALAACALLVAPADAAAAKGKRAICKPATAAAASAVPRTTPTRRLARAAVCLVNHRRVVRGLRRLRVNRRLSRAAARHSRDMVRHRYFGHVSRNGRDVVDRLHRTRYLGGRFSWMVGENLAWGSGRRGSPRQIVRSWMRSAGHRRNMLSRSFREIGIGVIVGSPVGTDLPAATYTTTFGFRH